MSAFVIYSMVWRWLLPAGHRTWRQTVQINRVVPPRSGKVSGCDALLSTTCTDLAAEVWGLLMAVLSEWMLPVAPKLSKTGSVHGSRRKWMKMGRHRAGSRAAKTLSFKRRSYFSCLGLVLRDATGSAGLGPIWKTVRVSICWAGGLVFICKFSSD